MEQKQHTYAPEANLNGLCTIECFHTLRIPLYPPTGHLMIQPMASFFDKISTQFDANKFVFVPKKGGDTAGSESVVTHFLAPIRELGILHHNVRLKPIPNVGPEFLFARFALAIFRLSERFLRIGVDRNLLGMDGVSKMVLANDCKKLIAWTRNQSPTKKSKRTLGADDSDLIDTEVGQRNHKRSRHDQSFRSSGIETVRCSSAGTDAVTALEEEPQTPQLQRSQTRALQEEWLKSERQRSDPENTWAQEQAWVESVWDGKTLMGPQEATRFYEFYGMESQEMVSHQ